MDIFKNTEFNNIVPIDYGELIKKNPWIISKNQKCILSPDCDGLLCGLLVSYYLKWQIKGFYDGKVMLLDKNTHAKECIFLDMDIFRKEIKSVGHHMVLYNKNKMPANWDNYDHCIQPNNLRNYDGNHNFSTKYPLATIHLLIGILNYQFKISIVESAICPLFYADGVFKNLFNYPENCLNWLKYLNADQNSLKSIFFDKYYSVDDLMFALKDFFNKINDISEGKRGGDKIKISNSSGSLINVLENENGYFIIDGIKAKAEAFLSILSELTSWRYNVNSWQWNSFNLFVFSKGTIKPNNKNFQQLMLQNPISWAMTSGLAIEYTLDKDNVLFK